MKNKACPTCGGSKSDPKIVVVKAAKGEAFCRDPFHRSKGSVQSSS